MKIQRRQAQIGTVVSARAKKRTNWDENTLVRRTWRVAMFVLPFCALLLGPPSTVLGACPTTVTQVRESFPASSATAIPPYIYSDSENTLDGRLGEDLKRGLSDGDVLYSHSPTNGMSQYILTNGIWQMITGTPIDELHLTSTMGLIILHYGPATTVVWTNAARALPEDPILYGRDSPETGWNLLAWPYLDSRPVNGGPLGWGFTNAVSGDMIYIRGGGPNARLNWNSGIGYWREGGYKSYYVMKPGQAFWYLRYPTGTTTWPISTVPRCVTVLPAEIDAITSTTADGAYTVGASINVTITFDKSVTLAGGNLTLDLDSGGTVVIPPFTSSTIASGTYTVGTGENSFDLNVVAITLDLSTTLKDDAGDDADLTLPVGDNLADNKDIVVDTTPPQIVAPADITVQLPIGASGATNVLLGFPEASDNYALASVSHDAPVVFPLGETKVIWTALDVAGNLATDHQWVNVIEGATVVFREVPMTVMMMPDTVKDVVVKVQNMGFTARTITNLTADTGNLGPNVSLIPPAPLPLSISSSEIIDVILRINTAQIAEGNYNTLLTVAADGVASVAGVSLDIVATTNLLPDLTTITRSGTVTVTPLPVDSNTLFTISTVVYNIGTADTGPFTVHFYNGVDLLGSHVIPGLALGASIPAQFTVTNGLPAGTYRLLVEIVSPPSGELRIDNNAEGIILKIGGSIVGADIVVKASASVSPNGRVAVAGYAVYVVGEEPTLQTYPVAGGLVSGEVLVTGPVFGGTHTDINGLFHQLVGILPQGTYTARVDVTDSSPLTGSTLVEFTVPAPQPPDPPPLPVEDLWVNGLTFTMDSPAVQVLEGTADLPAEVRALVANINQINVVLRGKNMSGDRLNQPVQILQHRYPVYPPQVGVSLPITTTVWSGTVDFMEVAGVATASFSAPWQILPPEDGFHYIEVVITPTFSQPTANDSGTHFMRSFDASAAAHSEVSLRITTASASPSTIYRGGLETIAGHAQYEVTAVGGPAIIPAIDANVELTTAWNGQKIYVRTGRNGTFRYRLQAPVVDGSYTVDIQVTDGGITRGFSADTSATSVSFNVFGPPLGPDVYIFSEDIFFSDSNPDIGEPIDIFAEPHYVHPNGPIDLPVYFIDHFPIEDTLGSVVIGFAWASFNTDGDLISMAPGVQWVPGADGAHIVEASLGTNYLPFTQYSGNDKATKAIFVGTEFFTLAMEPTAIIVSAGDTANYTLTGTQLVGGPENDVEVYVRSIDDPGTLPPGVSATINGVPVSQPGSITLTLDFTQTVVIGTTAATPAGTYSLVVVGDDGNATVLEAFTLIVQTPLVVDFEGEPVSGPEPLTVNFTDLTVSGNPLVFWSWSFGDGGTSNEQDPTYEYVQDGTYTVSLAVQDISGNTASATKIDYITVLDQDPVPDFAGIPTSGDEPLTVVFTDLSSSYDGIVSYSWNFGDGKTSTLQNPTNLYVQDGAYTVSLTVTEADGDIVTATKTNYITVDPVPTQVIITKLDVGKPPAYGQGDDVPVTVWAENIGTLPVSNLVVETWILDPAGNTVFTNMSPEMTFTPGLKYRPAPYTYSILTNALSGTYTVMSQIRQTTTGWVLDDRTTTFNVGIPSITAFRTQGPNYYDPGDDARLRAAVLNPGTDPYSNLVWLIEIYDPNGVRVDSRLSAEFSLAGGEALTWANMLFDTTGWPLGAYTASMVLSNTVSGIVYDDRETDFVIASAKLDKLKVNDKNKPFSQGDTVVIEVDAKKFAQADPVLGLDVTIEVRDPIGTVVHSYTSATFDLLVNGPYAITTQFALELDAVLGPYTFEAQLNQGSTVFDVEADTFAVGP